MAKRLCASEAMLMIFVALALTSFSHAQPPTPLGYVYWRNATQRTVGSVIPWPKEINFLNGLDYLAIDPANFRLAIGSNNPRLSRCAIVRHAIDRYQEITAFGGQTSSSLLFDDVKPSNRDDPNFGKRKRLGSVERLTLEAASDKFVCESMPHANMNEAYTLEISLSSTTATDHQKLVQVGELSPLARLSANSSWGLIRGLETLSQLIFNIRNDDDNVIGGDGSSIGNSGGGGGSSSGSKIYAIQPVRVDDEPRFEHRGFMLDTARHYIPLDVILQSLDAMAFNKLNVFHWHMVDDQSFPYESYTYPQLSKKTAFRPNMVYSQEQVKRVIQYAAERGIRVIAELDTPGHTYALRYVPNLLTACYNTTSNRKNGDYGPIDPTKISSYKSVAKLLNEFSTVFPETYFHAGGDEVDYDCWKSSPEINKWMVERNISGKYDALSNYYIRRLYDLVSHYNKTMIVWQEVFDTGAGLPKDAIVHVWKFINDRTAYMAELKEVVRSGYRAILSSCWYLNYIDYGQDWIKFYQCDPGSSPIVHEEERLVLGGEICMWTEFVDSANVISRTWPRASAAAERLWSPKTKNNVGEFLNRLEQMRCRLVYRGIQAEPVNGPGYC